MDTNLYYLLGIIALIAFVALFFFRRLLHVTGASLAFGLVGVITGTLIGSLLSIPLSSLPDPYGEILPTAITVVLAVLLAVVFVYQKNKASDWFFFKVLSKFEERVKNIEKRILKGSEALDANGAPLKNESKKEQGGIVVDTSVIIDGRIGDIAKTGFITEKLIVPRFVLQELQLVADSEEPLKRSRGRRGLDILNNLTKETGVETEIVEENYSKIKEVDHKLVKLAKDRGSDILTVDYNLNKVASIEGVKVLNINELANSIKAVVLPGESLKIKIIQQGKEKDQGVGYLEDGTMIVVEGGGGLIGKEVDCEVARIFQTAAGRMVFVSPKENE